MTLSTSKRCLGLLGGLGPAATVHHYHQILAGFSKRGITPRLVMSHAEANVVRDRVGAGDIEGLAAYLAEHVRTLAKAGANFAAIPATAPHICASELVRQIPIPLIDPIPALVTTLHSRILPRSTTTFVNPGRLRGRGLRRGVRRSCA